MTSSYPLWHDNKRNLFHKKASLSFSFFSSVWKADCWVDPPSAVEPVLQTNDGWLPWYPCSGLKRLLLALGLLEFFTLNNVSLSFFCVFIGGDVFTLKNDSLLSDVSLQLMLHLISAWNFEYDSVSLICCVRTFRVLCLQHRHECDGTKQRFLRQRVKKAELTLITKEGKCVFLNWFAH